MVSIKISLGILASIFIILIISDGFHLNNGDIRKQVISCNCSELEQTWHPGRIKHKLNCKKFWKLNPTLTKRSIIET